MYKSSKTRCRHYDQEGRLSSPSCPQGNSCRFLHPNDPGWASKASSSKIQGGSRDTAPRTSYRSAPLVPQSALFLRRRKNEELSMDTRGRDNRHYSDSGGTKRDYDFFGHRESASARRKDIEKDSPASRARRSNSEIEKFGPQMSPKGFDNRKKLQKYSDTSRTREVKVELKSGLLQSPEQSSKLAPHSREIVSFFGDLARLSREVDDLREVQRKEEANTQTYKKISATLESISASATTVIAPQLSRSLVAQADCRKDIEEKEDTMQRIWTDAVEAFVRDVTHEVDVGLQAALNSIKQEARQVEYSIPWRSRKRQRDEDDVEEGENIERDSNTSSEAIIREHKHRRAHDSSPGSSFDDMKLKIEQQAQMLTLLAQENNELRVTLDMEDISVSSPDSSASVSDSDAYNTESARLYFGPLKTPERKFVQGLFSSIQSTSPHQSPSSSSPHPSQPTDDNEDMEQVAQLINVPSGDEEHFSDSATPQTGDGIEDEPSSVLADRVMHALDNPSPPPSPSLPLSFFDPYHTTTPQSLTDYQNDLFSLSMNSRPEHDNVNSLSLSTTINSKAQTPETHPNVPSQLIQQDLISFDSIPVLPPSKEANGPPLLDDLLPHCSISVKSPRIQQTFEIPDLVVESPLENFLVESVAVMDLAQTVGSVEESDIILHNSKPQVNQLGVDHVLPQSSNIETPLRRSPRPRTSVTPNLVPPPAALPLPPSGARTQIKKLTTSDQSINGSQERDLEEEDVQQVVSQTTHGALWSARQRSPTRSPMSFNRVLGSLSPKSTDLLSKLAFTSTEEPNSNTSIGDADPSSNSQTQFTFSMFPTLPEPVIPKTPLRSIGSIRFSSPTRSTSPHKIRLQAPVPNGPMNTPARRITIEQGIAQGHVSPQKAAQLGFKSDGTPLTYIPTPARRVLVSEHLTTPGTRPGTIRFGSPSKGKERELSVEPISRPVVTMRMDREKTSGEPSRETLAKSESVQPKRLPFPLVASDPVTPTSLPIAPGTLQDDPTEAKSTGVKSYLRQPTSRIPRIGTKPYSRPPAPKSREKDPSTLLKRTGDHANTLQKSTTMESASIPLDAGRSATSSISRVKPTVLMSTSLLKRKREVEKPSPVKPRIIALRQVPKVVLSTTSSSKTRIEPTTVQNRMAAPQNSTLRTRRIMDAESDRDSRSIPQEHETSAVVYNPRHTETVMKSPETKEPSPALSLGSPMIQDPPDLLHDVLEPQLKPDLIAPDNIPTTDASSTSNSRRITRSRRTPVGEGKSRPLPTRRKPPATRSDDVFSGMSITALKDLTISNTTRNQEYRFAKLEMEVIRKEGVRPESPAVKIRTIVQRQSEEKLKERAERATRRARRSDGDMASSDVEGYSDAGYSSPSEDRSGQGTLIKHRRGPGDDEEYETPDRYKTKLFVEADNQGGEPERRVKWDRGLFTTVYLDEVKLGTRQPLKENRVLKGILAPTAKALRLDTLGNLPQTDLPLTDLVQENITIKKYVYDDDEVPAPEVIVVKNTRSKSKKSRS